MKILDLVQGSDEWKQARADKFTASEAAAMFGASKFLTRNDLLNMKKTGWEKPVSDFVQKKVFDKGHAVEAMARPIIEDNIIKEPLFPCVGISDEHPDLLASFDGLTMDESISMEHKQWNEDLAASVRDGSVVNNPQYFWQWEQGMLVSGAEKTIFVVSDGTETNMVHLEYESQPERRKELIAGWAQFKKDLEDFVPPQIVEVEAVGTTVAELPVITYTVDGTGIESNIAVYQRSVESMVALSVACKYESDQDFADAENRIRAFKENEAKAKVVADMIVAEVADINQVKLAIESLVAAMRKQRLIDEKQVKAKKIEIRSKVLEKANKKFSEFISGLNTHGFALAVSPDFAGSMKGKKTMVSLESACDDEIARCKILAEAQAELIDNNMTIINEHEDLAFLFNDKADLVFKDSYYVKLVVESRVNCHQVSVEAEAERKALLLKESEAKEELEPAAQKEETKKYLGEKEDFYNEMTSIASKAIEDIEGKEPVEILEEMEKDRDEGKPFVDSAYEVGKSDMLSLSSQVKGAILAVDDVMFMGDCLTTKANCSFFQRYVTKWQKVLNKAVKEND